MRRAILGCVVAVGVIVGGMAPAGAVTRSWTLTSAMPAPSQGAGFGGVSCATPTFCVAVGADDSNNQAPVIDAWDGSVWTSQTPAPVPSGEYGALFSVSCTSPTFCIAVGMHGTAHPPNTSTLAEAWDGVSWTVLDSQNPGAQFNQLDSVSCLGPTSCVAVGGEGELASHPMVQAWDGVSWTVVDQPTTAGGLLEGVSCTARFCLAIGTDDSSHVLVEHWNFDKLALVESPPAVGTYNYAVDVSCVARHWCAAVGYADEGSRTIGVHYAWDGTAWTTTDDSAAGENSLFEHVDCRARNDCLAVGAAQRAGAALTTPLLESWNGRAWKRNQTPRPRRAGLVDASCASATSCIAVGGYEPLRKNFVPYAITSS